MTKSIFKRILKHEGKEPRCENCGKTLDVGEQVLSKWRPHQNNVCGRTIRYCNNCRKLLGIWR